MDLNGTQFDLFLSWLDPDREEAGKKYEIVRRRLITLFQARGCAEAEDLADETINRVIRRAPELVNIYEGEPIRYFYKVAQHLHLEYLNGHAKKRRDPLPEKWPDLPHRTTEETDQKEQAYQCLELCLSKLTPNNRELVIRYYQENKQAKIEHRKSLAEWLGIPINALRTRLCRIRETLQECVGECVAQENL